MTGLLQLGWDVLFAFALWGTGFALLRHARMPNAVGAAGPLGASIFIGVGGWLNLFGLVRAPELVAMVIAGAITAAVVLYRAGATLLLRRLKIGRLRWFLCALLTAGVLLPAVTALTAHRTPTTLVFDDATAYLAILKSMLQNGSLQVNPYSGRALESSLGGGYFLQIFPMLQGGLPAAWAMDHGIAPVFLLLGVFSLWERFSGRPSVLLALLATVALLPLANENSTSVVLPVATVLAIVLVADGGREVSETSRIVLLALLCSGLAGLKLTYLPAAVCIPLLYYFTRPGNRPLSALRSFIAVSVLAAALLAPWMANSYRGYGTLLYPVLGTGTDTSRYYPALNPRLPLAGLRSPMVWELVLVLIAPLLAMASFCYLRPVSRRDAHWRSAACVPIAAAFCAASLLWATTGETLLRYIQPMLLASLLVWIAALGWSAQEQRRHFTAIVAVTALYILGASAIYCARGSFRILYWQLEPGYVQRSATLYTNALSAAPGLQNAIPPGDAALLTVSQSYAFDFHRNRLLLADWPGMASLPPGMPLAKGPEALRAYLLGQHIRYIIFEPIDYLDDPFRPRTPGETEYGYFAQKIAAAPTHHRWLYMQATVSRAVSEDLAALAQTHTKQSAGNIRVLDLLCEDCKSRGGGE